MRWDFFISHAHEDKDAAARPLAHALQDKGYAIWYDEFVLGLADRLHKSIKEGLANSRFGVVILSRHFFRKRWPQEELYAFFAREDDDSKVLIPILHDIEVEEVKQHDLLLADRIALKFTAEELPTIVQKLGQVAGPPKPSVSTVNLTGIWTGREGDMVLKQQGDHVSGRYDYFDRKDAGVLEGRWMGEELRYSWRWPYKLSNGFGIARYVSPPTEQLRSIWWFKEEQVKDAAYEDMVHKFSHRLEIRHRA